MTSDPDKTTMERADFGDVLRALKAGRKARLPEWDRKKWLFTDASLPDAILVNLPRAGRRGWAGMGMELFRTDWILFSDPDQLA